MPYELILNTGSYAIVDEEGRIYGINEARSLWESGKLAKGNRGFQKLVSLNFDLEAVKAYHDSLRGNSWWIKENPKW